MAASTITAAAAGVYAPNVSIIAAMSVADVMARVVGVKADGTARKRASQVAVVSNARDRDQNAEAREQRSGEQEHVDDPNVHYPRFVERAQPEVAHQ
jgi:hypothetical protein